jgi:hypothetical protein
MGERLRELQLQKDTCGGMKLKLREKGHVRSLQSKLGASGQGGYRHFSNI